MTVMCEALRRGNAEHSFLNNSLVWSYYIFKTDWVAYPNDGLSAVDVEEEKEVSAFILNCGLYHISLGYMNWV